MKLPATLALGVVVALAGCAHPSGRRSMNASPVSEEVQVIAQVCVPGGLSHEFRQHIGVSVVTPYSVLSEGQKATGHTSTEQPVFEFYTAKPKELRAILVWLMKVDGIRSDPFLFDPPKRVDSDSWSSWSDASAVAMENNGWGVGTGMVNGVKPKRMPVPSGSPVIRYRLMTFKRYLELATQRRESALDTDLPRCDAPGSGQSGPREPTPPMSR